MSAGLVAHGGGPTPVLNASLAGVIFEAQRHSAITSLYGSRFGLAGLLNGPPFDLFAQPRDLINAIASSPGSALGSSRRKLETADLERMFEVLRNLEVRYLFYTGGNGSMTTALELDRFARDRGYELNIVGIPKTIDNDLAGTDHAPGYGSCARFFAHVARDAGEDNRALPTPVMVIEVLGRNSGWVVAATALARQRDDDPPHLIYFPEQPLAVDRLCADVERVYRRLGRVVVALCEGQRDEQGGWFGADLGSLPGARDALPANLGHVIARLIWKETGLRARCERPGLAGRSCAALTSAMDRGESRHCGEAAVRAAIAARSGCMVCIDRVSTKPYRSAIGLVPLEEVAGRERPFPWIGWTPMAPRVNLSNG
jgi:ATP-dependent phosphofructokinase / diphosphate-dependent phosphofructokinase